jgi:hypothetical protein
VIKLEEAVSFIGTLKPGMFELPSGGLKQQLAANM